jgi:hypothetical protein
LKLHIIGALAAFALGTSAALAQTAPAPAPTATPAAAASPAPRAVQFNGAVDTLYTKTLGSGGLQFTNNLPASGTSDYAFGPQNARGFDYINNEFNFEDVNLSATLNSGAWGGRVLLNFGPQANVSYTYPSDFASFDVSQVWLSYTKGKLTLTGGKFGTLAGYESSESVNDTTVSRGILFWYQPATHVGGRLTYAPNSKITVIGGVNNGWNTWKEVSSGLTAEYGVGYTPNSTFSLLAQGYTGYARLGNYNGPNRAATIDFPLGVPAGDPTLGQGQKRLLDLVGTYHATPKLTLVANYDNGSQTCTTADPGAHCSDGTGWSGYATADTGSLVRWSGLAGYAIYQISPKLTGTIRYEGFHDANGFQTGYRQLWHEGTIAGSYAASSNLTLRGEYRRDKTSLPAFNSPADYPISTTGTYTLGTTGTDSNSTIGLEALVHF